MHVQNALTLQVKRELSSALECVYVHSVIGVELISLPFGSVRKLGAAAVHLAEEGNRKSCEASLNVCGWKQRRGAHALSMQPSHGLKTAVCHRSREHDWMNSLLTATFKMFSEFARTRGRKDRKISSVVRTNSQKMFLLLLFKTNHDFGLTSDAQCAWAAIMRESIKYVQMDEWISF